MIYTFKCTDEACDASMDVQASIKEGPPHSFLCPTCKIFGMERVWEMPQVISRSDPDEIPEKFKVADLGGGIGADGSPKEVSHREMMGLGKEGARRKNRAYQRYIEERRRLFREEKQVGGRMTHQVPAELYYAKMRQTGDKDYWSDPDNLNRHKSCKVS